MKRWDLVFRERPTLANSSILLYGKAEYVVIDAGWWIGVAGRVCGRSPDHFIFLREVESKSTSDSEDHKGLLKI